MAREVLTLRKVVRINYCDPCSIKEERSKPGMELWHRHKNWAAK